MNRRLSPNWNLDPTGFAGYLFVQNSLLLSGMDNPLYMLRRLDKSWSQDGENTNQLTLMDLEPGEEVDSFESAQLVTFPYEEDEYEH